jgi:hypothetical protein
MRLSVNIFTMTNREHRDERPRIVNLVNNSVGGCSNAPRTISVLQFLTSRRSRIFL